MNPELVEKAAKALHADVCCPADGRGGACVYPNDLWGDRHVARTVLDAAADDIRAEALADLAAAHPVPALTRAMNHARRAEDHWAADTVASLVDALTRCTRPHPTASEPPNGRLHHNHTTRGIKQRGECPACDAYHAQREQR